ncbi:MAG TPA: sodium:solute symporter [Candidatus Acidoferrales bacterium]|nr:sodium:solute symporter [Candidatus Acidoferrales bacterium]
MPIRSVDLAVLLLYLGGITAFGVRFRRGQSGVRDYFLGGRTAPWWALAASIVATETSTLTIIGTPAIAFAGTLGFLQLAIGYIAGRILISVVFLPAYFRGEFYTAYALIEKRFGKEARRVAAVTFLGTRALAEGVRLNAIGKIVSVAFGTGSKFSIAAITALTLLYTFEGGMKAVIWTDLVQLVLYLAGSAAAFWLLLGKIPGGWNEVVRASAAAGGKLQMFDFSLSLTQAYTFWAGVVGGTFLTLASHGTDQTIVQRLLAARNLRDSQRAIIASGLIVFAQFALFLLVGVMLFVNGQHAPLAIPQGDRDKIFPAFVVQQMPAGIAGLVLAAMFAVAMSNASGSLNSLASSSIMDFPFLRERSEGDPAALLRLSRRITLVWGALLGALALVNWGPVLVAGLTIASITYGSLLGLFLMCLLNPRATARGAITGMLAGLAVILTIWRYTPLAWTWYVLAGTVPTFLVGSLASLLDNSPKTSMENSPEK